MDSRRLSLGYNLSRFNLYCSFLCLLIVVIDLVVVYLVSC